MATNPKFPADIPRGHAKLERAAAAARRLVGLALTDPVDPFDVLVGLRGMRLRAGGAVYPLDYHVGELASGVEAKTHFRGDAPPLRESSVEIMMSNKTFADLEAGHPRALFSLLHELGHAVLHTNEVVRLSAIPHETAALLRGRFTDLKPYEDVEWQANVFASCYLMPALLLANLEVKGQLCPESLCQWYGASKESATARVSTFRQRRQELMAVYN